MVGTRPTLPAMRPRSACISATVVMTFIHAADGMLRQAQHERKKGAGYPWCGRGRWSRSYGLARPYLGDGGDDLHTRGGPDASTGSARTGQEGKVPMVRMKPEEPVKPSGSGF